eukprot:1156096-Pelagomonas_calceolata.AAC.2
MYFTSRGLLEEGLLGARRRRAGEEESGRPEAWQTTLQSPPLALCHPIYDDKTMTLALRHAFYSAILYTEATATFMFLPASSKLMIINPYSKLLTAYPHLCCKLGIIPKG